METNIMGCIAVFKSMGMKPNFSELQREFKMDRHTIRKLYEGKVPKERRNREGELSAHRDTIVEMLAVPGMNASAIFWYLKNEMGISTSYGNLRSFIWRHGLRDEASKPAAHPYFETDPGKQLQVDWVESISLGRTDGGVETFNLFSATLGYSRYHYFEYSEFKGEADFMMVNTAGFPYVRTFDDYDFTCQPKLNRDEVLDLRNLRFLEKAENIVFVGSPGTGKTHLAVSIGMACAKARKQVHFINCNDLIMQLKKAKVDGMLDRRMRLYANYTLLIIDEVGFLPIDSEDSNLLFQLISARYEKRSTVFTTNKGFNKWGEMLGDSVIANAMLDRILHHCRVFQIVGPSYRMKGKENLFKEE